MAHLRVHVLQPLHHLSEHPPRGSGVHRGGGVAGVKHLAESAAGKGEGAERAKKRRRGGVGGGGAQGCIGLEFKQGGGRGAGLYWIEHGEP